MTRPKTYLLQFSYERPYPFTREIRITAGNMGTAVNRGFKELRKVEKGRRIKEMSVKITYLL